MPEEKTEAAGLSAPVETPAPVEVPVKHGATSHEFEWTIVWRASGGGDMTIMAELPGKGWLFKDIDKNGCAMCFVPDESNDLNLRTL